VYAYEQLIGGAGRALEKIFDTGVNIAKGEEVMPVPFRSLVGFIKTAPKRRFNLESSGKKKPLSMTSLGNSKPAAMNRKNPFRII